MNRMMRRRAQLAGGLAAALAVAFAIAYGITERRLHRPYDVAAEGITVTASITRACAEPAGS